MSKGVQGPHKGKNDGSGAYGGGGGGSRGGKGGNGGWPSTLSDQHSKDANHPQYGHSGRAKTTAPKLTPHYTPPSSDKKKEKSSEKI